DGIRDFHVTGVQTCALPIFYFVEKCVNSQSIPFHQGLYLSNINHEHKKTARRPFFYAQIYYQPVTSLSALPMSAKDLTVLTPARSEERRVGKEARTRGTRVQ